MANFDWRKFEIRNSKSPPPSAPLCITHDCQRRVQVSDALIGSGDREFLARLAGCGAFPAAADGFCGILLQESETGCSGRSPSDCVAGRRTRCEGGSCRDRGRGGERCARSCCRHSERDDKRTVAAVYEAVKKLE